MELKQTFAFLQKWFTKPGHAQEFIPSMVAAFVSPPLPTSLVLYCSFRKTTEVVLLSPPDKTYASPHKAGLAGTPEFECFVRLFVGVVALIPTFIKAKKQPETETKITWLLGTISAVFALVSVGMWNWQLLVLPLNAALMQGYMVYILYFEARRKKH